MVVRVVMRAQLIVERTFAVLESMHDVMFEEKCTLLLDHHLILQVLMKNTFLILYLQDVLLALFPAQEYDHL